MAASKFTITAHVSITGLDGDGKTELRNSIGTALGVSRIRQNVSYDGGALDVTETGVRDGDMGGRLAAFCGNISEALTAVKRRGHGEGQLTGISAELEH